MARRKRNKELDMVLGPVTTFTMAGASIPVTYGIMGAAGRTPGASASVGHLSRHMGTSYNLIGIGGMTQGSMGLLDMMKDMERMTKKRKRR